MCLCAAENTQSFRLETKMIQKVFYSTNHFSVKSKTIFYDPLQALKKTENIISAKKISSVDGVMLLYIQCSRQTLFWFYVHFVFSSLNITILTTFYFSDFKHVTKTTFIFKDFNTFFSLNFNLIMHIFIKKNIVYTWLNLVIIYQQPPFLLLVQTKSFALYVR